MKDEHITRQYDLVPPHILETPVTIIGAGSIGSFTALALAKMGWRRLTVIDFDKVDIVNMSCQMHRHGDIGKPKASALADIIHEFTGGLTTVKAVNEKWNGEAFPGIVISAVDSLEVRSKIWNAHLDSYQTKFIIDARMGAEVASLYVMNPQDVNDRKTYPKSLTSDERAVQAPCTAKSTTYTAILIGGLIAQATKECLLVPNYLKSVDWNIKEHRFTAWTSGSKTPC